MISLGPNNTEIMFMIFFASNIVKLIFLGSLEAIDLLAILQKSLDRTLFLYIFIHEVRLSGVRASISIVHIQKF